MLATRQFVVQGAKVLESGLKEASLPGESEASGRWGRRGPKVNREPKATLLLVPQPMISYKKSIPEWRALHSGRGSVHSVCPRTAWGTLRACKASSPVPSECQHEALFVEADQGPGENRRWTEVQLSAQQDEVSPR